MWDELKKLLKHTTIYGVGGLLGKMAGFLLIPFYTHYLVPAQYGTLELLDLSLSLATLILNVVVAAPLVRFYYDYDDEAQKKRVVSTAMLTAATVALAIGAVGFMNAPGLSRLVLRAPGFALYFRIITASFVLMCVNSVAWNYLRAQQRSVLIVSVNLISLVVTLSLNIYFIAGRGMGVLGVLCSGLIGHLLTTAIIGTHTLRKCGLGFDAGKLKAMATFGGPLIVTTLGSFALNFSDRFFLQHFRNTAVVGVYALGYKFGFMLNFLLIQPFFMIWPPRMYAMAGKENARDMVARFGSYFCLVLVTGVLAISVIIKDVISIIAGPEYQAAYRIVPIVALAYVCQGMTSYFQVPLMLRKKTVHISLTGACGGMADLLLNFILIPRYGAMGAAWATLISFAIAAVLAFLIAQKIYQVPYRLSRLLVPLIVAVAVYFAADLVRIPSPWWSALVKSGFVAVFAVGVYLVGFFDRLEIEKAKSILGTLTGYRLGAAMAPERIGPSGS